MNRLIQTGLAGPPSSTQQTLPSSFQDDQSRRATSPINFFLPARYEPNYRYPLIVWLHQDGGTHQQVADVMPHISTQNYVAVGVRAPRALDASGQSFGWIDSPLGTAIAEEAVFSAIDTAISRYSIHPERVYLAGYRQGGTMAVRLGLRSSARVDGVISIDGALPRGGSPLANLSDARQLAVLSAVALESTRYPMQQVCEDVKLWHAARLRMDMRQYTVDDCMVTEVLRDVNHWLMARVTGQTTAGCVPDNETLPVEFSAN